MAVLVEEVTTTKSGKGLRVKLGGNWYGAFLDSGLNGQKGKMIEAEIVTHEKFGPTITAWRPSESAAPQTPPPQQSVPPVAASVAAAPRYAEPSDNVAPWYWPSVSNVAAAAIAHGLITKPEELNMWALKWAQVCVATKDAVK